MAEDSVARKRDLGAIESADPELSNALERLAEEEEQALQHALRDPATVAAPPGFLDKVMAQVKAEDSVARKRDLGAIESADPELSNALERLAEEEEQALQHALRDPATVAAPPGFLDKVMAQVKAEDSVARKRDLGAIESADPELSNALERLAEEEEQALQHALRDPATVAAPPGFLDKVMAQVKAEDSVARKRDLGAIESADPELSNALERLAEEEEQALQHALRDPATVAAPPGFLDKVMAQVKAEDSVARKRDLGAIESADPELSNALERLAEEEEQALQHALRDPATVAAPPGFLDKVMAQVKAEDSVARKRDLGAIESADPELSNALERLAEEEEQALQHALRDPATVAAPPGFLDKVMAQVKAEDSVARKRDLGAIESADPELSNALERLAEEEEQALQHALRDPATVTAPPGFLDKVMAQVKAEDSVARKRDLGAIESADPELSNALERLAEEEEQALQHALRDPATVAAPPGFLDKVMAQVKAEDSVARKRDLGAIESADPELSNALERLAEEEEQALQHALRDPATVAAPPGFLDKVMAQVNSQPPHPPWLYRIREWLSNPGGWFPSPDFGRILWGLGGAANAAVAAIIFLPSSTDSITSLANKASTSFVQRDYKQSGELYLKAADKTAEQTHLEARVRAAEAGRLISKAASVAWYSENYGQARKLYLKAEAQARVRAHKIDYLALAAKAAFSGEAYEESKRLYLNAAQQTATEVHKIPYLIGAAQAASFIGAAQAASSASTINRLDLSKEAYEESKRLYLDAAGIPLARAAKAAWYACDYQTAITILEEQFRGGKETTEMHFILGSAYHIHGNLEKAIEHYQQIVDSDQKDQSHQFVEPAWFNLGVAYAALFKEGQATKELALEALAKSLAEATDRKNRINTIQAAREPFSDRPENTCGEDYYATEDLTPLAELPELNNLLEGTIVQAARFGKSEEEKKRILVVADLEKRIETAAKKAGANQEDPGSPEA